MESVLAQSHEIISLARSKTSEDRERLLQAVTELCERNDAACAKPEAQALLSEIFMGLVVQAERDIRKRLAERLASATWAPRALVNILALDDIEIARPLIARSPVLQDHDLVRLLVEATLEHQIEVARRPGIGATVVNAIVDQNQPAVLIALAGNETADVSPLAMQRLVAASQRIAALRGSLAQHPRLTADLAQALYGWVGEAVRANIASRFNLDPQLLASSVSDAVTETLSDPEPRSQADVVREREDMERRLIAKLHAADQLKPGFLLRSLREGRLVRFEAALAALGGYAPGEVRKAMDATPGTLALACAGVGLDRSVFPTILSLVRALNGGRPPSVEDSGSRTNQAFAKPANEAAAEFRKAVSAI